MYRIFIFDDYIFVNIHDKIFSIFTIKKGLMKIDMNIANYKLMGQLEA